MNKVELKELLDLVAAVDGRTITATVLEAWHPVIGFISLSDAKEALVLARRDETIGRVEPKHIVAKFKELRSKRAVADEQEAQAKNKSEPGVPCPKCVHSLKIVDCKACCKAMAESRDITRTFYDLTGVRTSAVNT